MKYAKKILSAMLVPAMLLAGCTMSAKALPEPASVTSLPEGFISSLNQAGNQLYTSMAASNAQGNTFISPVSMYLAYAMLYNGAQGESAKEMQENLFKFDADLAVHNGNAKYLMEYLTADREGVDIKLANSIWVEKEVEASLNSQFVQYNKQNLKAQVEALDFADPESAAKINNWVSESTNGMIKQIVDSLKPADIMYLINCVYLDAKWQESFDSSLTHPDTFYAPDSEIEAQFMTKKGTFSYVEDETMQAVKLPYADGKTSMVVVLPKNGLDSINPFKDLSKITSKIEPTHDMTLNLPKTEIEYSDEGAFQNALMSAGLTSIFDSGKADLKGIADLNGQNIFVGETKHKTALKIDESGTQAAAATSIGIMRASMPLKTVNMTVDKPFYCAIIDDATGMILFCGSISNPTVK